MYNITPSQICVPSPCINLVLALSDSAKFWILSKIVCALAIHKHGGGTVLYKVRLGQFVWGKQLSTYKLNIHEGDMEYPPGRISKIDKQFFSDNLNYFKKLAMDLYNSLEEKIYPESCNSWGSFITVEDFKTEGDSYDPPKEFTPEYYHASMIFATQNFTLPLCFKVALGQGI